MDIRWTSGGLAAVLLPCLVFATPSACAEVTVPDDYASLGAALEAIADGDTAARTVIVATGTLDENVSVPLDLPAGVVVRGAETARTLWNGGLVINNIVDFRVSRFSFTGSGPAIQVIGSTVTIANNIFRLDDGAVAVVSSQAEPVITNNVFRRGAVAIDAGGNPVILENNAFIDNDTVLANEGPGSIITNNAFFGVEAFGDLAVSGDPLFTDPDRGDFHLRADSPLIDAGLGEDTLDDSDADIGAYGGEHAEGRPFPVQAPEVLAVDSDGLENSVTLTWPANRWYRLGGYRFHYDIDNGPPYTGSGADQGDSPIDVPAGSGASVEFTLSGLTGADPGDLEPPVLEAAEPGDRRLRLRWSASPGATGYLVHYRVDGSDAIETVDVGNVTTFTLTGLDNGTDYRIHVTAIRQQRYVFAITAYPAFDNGLDSAFSEQVSAAIGQAVESLPSNEVVDFPEAIIAFPDLPDDGIGCFIATAAFGHYGADELRTLRRFRDSYLLGHAPGRAFVGWYYRHSPRWAAALEDHPALKPPVRLALLPLVTAAGFALQAPVTALIAASATACLLIALPWLVISTRRRGAAATRGAR